MNIIEMKLADVIPYENNPRRNEEAVQYVANSIREFGFKVPIIVDKENVIVAGHTRALAAELLGLEKVPVIKADDLTDEQVRAFRIADNKTSEFSAWDNEALKMELEGILDDFDMTDFGFGEFELSVYTSDFEPEPFDDELINQYSENEQDYLAKKRIIITYSESDEDELAGRLCIEKISKVMYEFEELFGGEADA